MVVLLYLLCLLFDSIPQKFLLHILASVSACRGAFRTQLNICNGTSWENNSQYLTVLAGKLHCIPLAKFPLGFFTLAQMFSCEFSEISKNTFSTEHLQLTASVLILNYSPFLEVMTSNLKYWRAYWLPVKRLFLTNQVTRCL